MLPGCGRWLRLDEYERRRGARHADSGRYRRIALRLDVQVRHVDDARQTAQAIEKVGEIVVAPIEVERDRKLGVEILRYRCLGLETKNVEAGLGGELLDFPKQVVHLFRVADRADPALRDGDYRWNGRVAGQRCRLHPPDEAFLRFAGIARYARDR